MIQYARSSDGFLAYQVLGSGPIDLLRFDEITTTSIDSISEEPRRDRFDRRLASFARLIRFDRRGIGLSDGHSVLAPLTLEQSARDALAVLDAVGSQQAAVFGEQAAITLCAMFPSRVTHLLLLNAFARLAQDSDYEWGVAQTDLDDWMTTVPDPTLDDDDLDDVSVLAPSLADDPQFRAHWSRAGRRGASPAIARAQMQLVFQNDVRAVLPTLTIPTLVMHRPRNRVIVPEHGQFLTSHIRDASYVELPGEDYLFFGDDADASLDEIEEFLTGVRGGAGSERVLATVLFTDVVQSTEKLVAAGDREWRVLLDHHDAFVRAQLTRFNGREVSTAGDSFFAVFDGPARALRCAQAIVEGARALGIDVRAGVHAGECEVRGLDYGGIAVHIGARVAALAEPGQVLTTSTVQDLVGGSDIMFADHGYHDLKGIPEARHLFRVI